MDTMEHSTDLVEAERAALAANRVQYTGTSRTHCIDCEELIPQRRREAIAGCTRCTDCQEMHAQRRKNR